MVVRATPVRFWNWRMSSMTISACSIRSELLQGGVHGGSLVIDLGGAAPDHGGACHAGALLELADVVHDHLGVLHLGTRGLDVGAFDALDEVLVEDGLHGLNRRDGHGRH